MNLPYDLNDPRSLYNLVPQWMRLIIHEIPKEQFFWPENKLKENARADARLCRIRLAFWGEYEEAQASLRSFDIFGISKRCGISQHFIREFLSEPQHLAFVLCPPASYDIFLEEALQFGLGKLREILELPLTDPATGAVNHKTADLVLKATAFIDMRINGGFVNKNLNLHAFKNGRDEKNFVKELSSDEIDKKIKELEDKREFITHRNTIGNVRVPEVELLEVAPVKHDDK